MKSFIKPTITLLPVLVLSLSLAACGDDTKHADSGTANTEPTATATLIADSSFG